jgi:hypothetical protein
MTAAGTMRSPVYTVGIPGKSWSARPRTLCTTGAEWMAYSTESKSVAREVVCTVNAPGNGCYRICYRTGWHAQGFGGIGNVCGPQSRAQLARFATNRDAGGQRQPNYKPLHCHCANPVAPEHQDCSGSDFGSSTPILVVRFSRSAMNDRDLAINARSPQNDGLFIASKSRTVLDADRMSVMPDR